jgi:hypothetical protein
MRRFDFMGNLQKHKFTSGRARAFTRTELAAIMAAVVVMAGLVLPALARSNNGSTRAVCFNNMRQMGLAMSMYAADSRDYLAFCNWDGGNALAQGYLYGPGPAPDPTEFANYAAAWKEGSWFKYVNDPASYLCPLDIRQANYQQRNNKLCSYVMDGAACGFMDAPPIETTKITLIWSPGCFLMWEPDTVINGAFEYNDGANYPTAPPTGSEGVGLLHTQTGGNIMRCDGGVEFITATNFAKDSNTPPGEGPGPRGKTYVWWSTFSINGH